MDFPQQHGDRFPGNFTHAVDVPWNATASPAFQNPQSAPSSDCRPLPAGQLHGHAGAHWDAMVSNWHHHHGVPPIHEDLYIPVLFSVPVGECCRYLSTERAKGGHVPTCREPCRTRSTGRSTARRHGLRSGLLRGMSSPGPRPQ